MQSTIYGAACMARARTKTKEQSESITWTDEDLAFRNGLEDWSDGRDKAPAKPQRLFKAWYEPWEKKSVKNKDVVAEAKLLAKYGDLKWLDPDSKQMMRADADSLEWKRSLCGWGVISINETTGELETWAISLLPKLIGKTQQESHVQVEFKPRQNKRKRGDDDSDSSSSDSSSSDSEQ